MPLIKEVEDMDLVLVIENIMPELHNFPRIKCIVSDTDIKIQVKHLIA